MPCIDRADHEHLPGGLLTEPCSLSKDHRPTGRINTSVFSRDRVGCRYLYTHALNNSEQYGNVSPYTVFSQINSPVVYNSTFTILQNGITTQKGDPDAWVQYLGTGKMPTLSKLTMGCLPACFEIEWSSRQPRCKNCAYETHFGCSCGDVRICATMKSSSHTIRL